MRIFVDVVDESVDVTIAQLEELGCTDVSNSLRARTEGERTLVLTCPEGLIADVEALNSVLRVHEDTQFEPTLTSLTVIVAQEFTEAAIAAITAMQDCTAVTVGEGADDAGHRYLSVQCRGDQLNDIETLEGVVDVQRKVEKKLMG